MGKHNTNSGRVLTGVDGRREVGKAVRAVNHDHWRQLLVNNVVPDNEGKLSDPVSLRIPEKLLNRLDACAKATGNPRYETILHLLRWSLAQYESETAGPQKKSA